MTRSNDPRFQTPLRSSSVNRANRSKRQGREEVPRMCRPDDGKLESPSLSPPSRRSTNPTEIDDQDDEETATTRTQVILTPMISVVEDSNAGSGTPETSGGVSPYKELESTPANSVGDDSPSSDPLSPSSTPPSRCRSACQRAVALYWEHEFLILVVAAIGLARAYPPLGAIYLAPDITASWVAVVFIFLLAGLGLKTSEFSNALRQVKFNAFVQLFNFGVDSAIVYGVSRLLLLGKVLDESLANGMTIAASLPLTINMVFVLTKAAGGDEAAAVFNAAFGNLVGVFLSPALILGYLGVSGEVDVVGIFYKLAARVVLPVAVGQVLQYTSKTLMDFMATHKAWTRQAQQYALIFIVYTVFAEQFMEESETDIASIFIMIAVVFLLLVFLMVLAWYALRLFFPDQPKLRVMGLFGATHKTVAMGLPLISAIYDGNPNVGLYSLPLLCWHPLQLLLGSLLVPRLAAFVKREEERLGIVDGKAPGEGTASGTEQEAQPSTDPARAAEEGSVHRSSVSCTSKVVMNGSMQIEVTAEESEEDGTDSVR